MPAPFSSIRLARYAPASRMAAHHHDEASLCLVLSGDYEETIRGRAADHGAGALLYCPSGEPHAQRFGKRGAVKLLFRPTAATLDHLAEHVALREAPSLRSARIGDLGRRMAFELALDDPFSAAAIDGLSHELLALFGRGARDTASGPEPWLRAARDYIEAHADRPVSLDDVARAAGRPAAQLSRAFRRTFGRSVGEHQRQLRLARAADLLAHTRTPLSEVAQICGFCDQAHLNRAFKAETGVTPAAYRRLS
ncbi:AraC family transcriptional regulator [Caulobacter mirabilis]|uniref:AraC family transcriptional regulator n=1 Tax=Caulobacter mirabilis TaxID=69666 RepID=A0A2D2B2I9_9CAUL|nr:AraC family transcriptional regulator [Caulobacter mirabilis]ATQ44437.1 AraC family transcriptional regulator [Caulobacter mirabilis]